MNRFFFILFSLLAMRSFPQKLEVIYEAFVRQTYSEEEKKKWFDDTEMGKAQMEANESPPIETYKMFISGMESSFVYQERINNSQEQRFDIRYAPAGFGTTYQNLSDSIQMKDIGEIYGKRYYTHDPLMKLGWKILREEKESLGYKVQKAVLEDSISTTIAWYAPEIQISHGPAEFWGLPGLILEIEKSSKERDYKIFYKAETIKKIKKIRIIKPNKGTQISETEIERLWEEGKIRREKYSNSQDLEKD